MLLPDSHTCLTNTTIRIGSVNVGWTPERKATDFFMILYDIGCFGPHVWTSTMNSPWVDPTTNGSESLLFSCSYRNCCTYWTYLYLSGRPERLRVAYEWLRPGRFGSARPSLVYTAYHNYMNSCWIVSQLKTIYSGRQYKVATTYNFTFFPFFQWKMKLLYCFIFWNIVRDMLKNAQYHSMTKMRSLLQEKIFFSKIDQNHCAKIKCPLYSFYRNYFSEQI